MNDTKALPADCTWFGVESLDPATTATELAEYFCAHGLGITEEHIVMKPFTTDYGNGLKALVAVPQRELASLATWAMRQDTLNGKLILVRAWTRGFKN
jgi:hypothetical protein